MGWLLNTIMILLPRSCLLMCMSVFLKWILDKNLKKSNGLKYVLKISCIWNILPRIYWDVPSSNSFFDPKNLQAGTIVPLDNKPKPSYLSLLYPACNWIKSSSQMLSVMHLWRPPFVCLYINLFSFWVSSWPCYCFSWDLMFATANVGLYVCVCLLLVVCDSACVDYAGG